VKVRLVAILTLLASCSPPPDSPSLENSSGTNGGDNSNIMACQSDEECQTAFYNPIRPWEAYCEDQVCRDCNVDADCREDEYCTLNNHWCREWTPTPCESFEDCGDGPVMSTCHEKQCVGCGPDPPGPDGGECPDGWFCWLADREDSLVSRGCIQIATSSPQCVDSTCEGTCEFSGDGVVCLTE